MVTSGNDNAPIWATVGVDLENVMASLADTGVTAKVAYAAVLDEVLVRYQQIPNGAQLTEMVSAFNRGRIDRARLPLGTAGTASEAVSAFRQKLAKGYRSRMPLETVSPNIAQKVASLFDEIVVEVRETLAEQFDRRLEEAQARHVEETGLLVKKSDEKRHQLLSQCQALSTELHAANLRADGLSATVANQEARIADLVAGLDVRQGKLQNALSDLAVSAEKVNQLETERDSLKAAIEQALASEAEERRVRLLTLDANRQMALSLEREVQQHQATVTENKELRHRLEEMERQVVAERERAQQSVDQSAKLIEQVAALDARVAQSLRKRPSPKVAAASARLPKRAAK